MKIFTSFYFFFLSRDIGKTNIQTFVFVVGFFCFLVWFFFFFFNSSSNYYIYSVSYTTIFSGGVGRNILSLSAQFIVFFNLKVFGCWMEM